MFRIGETWCATKFGTHLESGRNNFLGAIHFTPDNIGAAFLDVSTGEFFAAEGNATYIEKLVSGFQPSEIIFERNQQQRYYELFGNRYHTFHLEDWAFQHEFAYELLTRQFGTHSLKGIMVM